MILLDGQDSVYSDLISVGKIPRKLGAVKARLQLDGSTVPMWAAPPLQDGDDMSAGRVPPFRERVPWFGGDLQTLRNFLRGTPSDLPRGERLLLEVTGGDRLAARLDRPSGPLARPLVVLVHGLAGSEESG